MVIDSCWYPMMYIAANTCDINLYTMIKGQASDASAEEGEGTVVSKQQAALEKKRRTSVGSSADEKVRLAGVQVLKKKGGSGKITLSRLRDFDTPDLQDEVSPHSCIMDGLVLR